VARVVTVNVTQERLPAVVGAYLLPGRPAQPNAGDTAKDRRPGAPVRVDPPPVDDNSQGSESATAMGTSERLEPLLASIPGLQPARSTESGWR
jgi:hypothetical protein